MHLKMILNFIGLLLYFSIYFVRRIIMCKNILKLRLFAQKVGISCPINATESNHDTITDHSDITIYICDDALQAGMCVWGTDS